MRKGSKTHIAVDALGNSLSMIITPANEQERGQVGAPIEELQNLTGDNVKIAYVDQGYTSKEAAQEAGLNGIKLSVFKLEQAGYSSISSTAFSSWVPRRHRWSFWNLLIFGNS